MLSSLLRPKKGRRNRDRSPFSSPYAGIQASPIAAQRSTQEERRRAAADFDGDDSLPDDDGLDEEEEENDEIHVQDEDGDEGEGDHGETTPLLPIFSAAQLDALPVYNLTHTVRLLVVPRCETTLSWDQLRSPQVSQFLVKPIQQQILTSHFSKATLYALMANCLQFAKEVQLNPGNSGVSKTRALVCELLAIKLLKEYSTRELIDALSYDFFPLQGLVAAGTGTGTVTPAPNWESSKRTPQQPRAARISALEIAIRAQSKRFLAHPLVVQQLEAIWAGTIVFHSAADNLHRPAKKVTPNQNRGYGATGTKNLHLQASPNGLHPAKQRDHQDPVIITIRRSVTLYDPRDASLFKLSRLRVPRYRQFLSTCSFAVLLGLFLAVLMERSLHITVLEIIFWFWSAGFMLDEIVGFNEQGFSLYIMSFWNTFDLGILLLLICYYCMRIYGILMPDLRKHYVANIAYDILAANSVLLFPRLFSVLDHYRYFSQLLIAFRMMAVDLVAVFILIIISCSGFFVAFTLSFGNDDFDANRVAYALFQILMGFTPAAWEQWPNYNFLGKIILTLFLFICHFLIVTILITVLTNSFMAIVQNANEEHQFVFAVNAISMVKSDALFSYVAPTNVIAWILAPFRYILPFQKFVRLNRTVIKITHFPVLFMIYAYERTILRHSAFEPTELVEQRGRSGPHLKALDTLGAGMGLFSPKPPRLREPSIATMRKDRALDEVFRRPFKDNTVRGTFKSQERRKTSNVVNHWMQTMGPDGTASPPVEQDHSIVDRLETRRPVRRQSQSVKRRQGMGREFTTSTIASDPEDFLGTELPRPMTARRLGSDLPHLSMEDLPEPTEGDGDDELLTNDDDDHMTLDRRSFRPGVQKEHRSDYFGQKTPTATTRPGGYITPPQLSFAAPPEELSLTQKRIARPIRKPQRNLSTNTILYNPTDKGNDSSSSPSRNNTTAKNSAKNTAPPSGAMTPLTAGRRTPKRPIPGVGTRARPIMPPRAARQSAPNLAGMLNFNSDQRLSSSLMDIGSDLGDNKAVGGGFVGAVPNSFATQMAFATGAMRAGQAGGGGNEDQRMMGRLMLARMNGLEEGFREVLKEVKDWRREDNRSGDEKKRRSMNFDGGDRYSGGGGAGGNARVSRRPTKKGGKRDGSGNGNGKAKTIDAEATAAVKAAEVEDAKTGWVDENVGPVPESGAKSKTGNSI